VRSPSRCSARPTPPCKTVFSVFFISFPSSSLDTMVFSSTCASIMRTVKTVPSKNGGYFHGACGFLVKSSPNNCAHSTICSCRDRPDLNVSFWPTSYVLFRCSCLRGGSPRASPMPDCCFPVFRLLLLSPPPGLLLPCPQGCCFPAPRAAAFPVPGTVTAPCAAFPTPDCCFPAPGAAASPPPGLLLPRPQGCCFPRPQDCDCCCFPHWLLLPPPRLLLLSPPWDCGGRATCYCGGLGQRATVWSTLPAAAAAAAAVMMDLAD
jgi:hypothetical protein